MSNNNEIESVDAGKKYNRQIRLDKTTNWLAVGLGIVFTIAMGFTAFMVSQGSYPTAISKAAENTLEASQELITIAKKAIKDDQGDQSDLLKVINSTLVHIKEIKSIIDETIETLDNSFWEELFKTGFLLIGGSLTSVVGYYFGNQGIDSARRSAEQAQEMAEVAKREAKRAEDQEKNAKASEKQAKEKEAEAIKLAKELERVTQEFAPTDEESVEGIIAVEINDD